MLKNIKLGWPQVVLASVAIVTLAAVYLLAVEDRETIEKAVLAVWALVSTFLGSAIRKHSHDDDDDDGAS